MMTDLALSRFIIPPHQDQVMQKFLKSLHEASVTINNYIKIFKNNCYNLLKGYYMKIVQKVVKNIGLLETSVTVNNYMKKLKSIVTVC